MQMIGGIVRECDDEAELARNGDEFRETLTELRQRVETLTEERDEARRMWCEAEAVGNCLSVDDMKVRARTEAKRRGWDCFKETKE
jgi:hypothetical protein